MVMLLLFLTFSTKLSIFPKDQSHRLTRIIWSYVGAWIQPNVGCIPRSKRIKSQLKAWIWKELFQLVINTFQCNAKTYKVRRHFLLYTAVYISSEKNIGIVGSVLLPTFLKAFVKLHYEDVYVSQLEKYPCSETQT